jgi:hypothetical protein
MERMTMGEMEEERNKGLFDCWTQFGMKVEVVDEVEKD